MHTSDDEGTVLNFREAAEQAEALLLASELPDEWVADTEVAREAIVAAEGSADDGEAMRALLAPLEPAAQARVLDRVVGEFLRTKPAAAPEGAAPVPRARGRWWLVASLPLTAAVAAVVTLAIVTPQAMHRVGSTAGDGSVAGEVRVSSGLRGAGGSGSTGSDLRVPAGEGFYLDWHAAGRALNVVAVHAEPLDPVDHDVRPRVLGWERRATAPDGATLAVEAHLPCGRWKVTCEMHEPATGRLLRLDPPAFLVVECSAPR